MTTNTKFLIENTPLVAGGGNRDRVVMTTTATRENAKVTGQEDEPAQARVLPVDWTESEWFRIWLKLARNEYHPEDLQEAAC